MTIELVDEVEATIWNNITIRIVNNWSQIEIKKDNIIRNMLTTKINIAYECCLPKIIDFNKKWTNILNNYIIKVLKEETGKKIQLINKYTLLIEEL